MLSVLNYITALPCMEYILRIIKSSVPEKNNFFVCIVLHGCKNISFFSINLLALTVRAIHCLC